MSDRLLRRSAGREFIVDRQVKPASLIGVIDLQDGVAVHAIAGRRNAYRPVDLTAIGQTDGCPIALLTHYVSLDLRRFYLADLNALAGGQLQVSKIEQLIDCIEGFVHAADPWVAPEFWIDVGWQGDGNSELDAQLHALSQSSAMVRFIAATESMRTLASLEQIAKIVGASRLALGVDYRNGNFLRLDGDLHDWISSATEQGIHHFVVLDVATVGVQQGIATHLPRKIQRLLQDQATNRPVSIYSGGGVRSAHDVQQFLQAGCNACLVATGLLPGPK